MDIVPINYLDWTWSVIDFIIWLKALQNKEPVSAAGRTKKQRNQSKYYKIHYTIKTIES